MRRGRGSGQDEGDRDVAVMWVLLMGVVAGMVATILGVWLGDVVTAFIITGFLGGSVLVFLWARGRN